MITNNKNKLIYKDNTASTIGNVSSGTHKTFILNNKQWARKKIKIIFNLEQTIDGGGTRLQRLQINSTAVYSQLNGNNNVVIIIYPTRNSGSQTLNIYRQIQNYDSTGESSATVDNYALPSIDIDSDDLSFVLDMTNSFTGGTASFRNDIFEIYEED